jgi:3-oxoacyl-[acyl-carrier protein] reductase
MAAGLDQDPSVVDRVTATMAMHKIARPEDVASTITWLLSPTLAGHVSGAIVPVAGGMEGRLLHG